MSFGVCLVGWGGGEREEGVVVCYFESVVTGSTSTLSDAIKFAYKMICGTYMHVCMSVLCFSWSSADLKAQKTLLLARKSELRRVLSEYEINFRAQYGRYELFT